MSKTAVGLFENSGAAVRVVRDLEATSIPRSEVRTLGEPMDMAVTGAMSFPHTDFEVGLDRELKAIGASAREANAYAQRVRRGGVLVFATGTDAAVDSAAEIMNRHGALKVEELIGDEPNIGSMIAGNLAPAVDGPTQTGRIRQEGGGARMFVW
jgi:hypothetical protein